jgi:hypothetical protein
MDRPFSSRVKERANESTRSYTGENENFIETFLLRQLTDHKLKVLNKPIWANVSSRPLVKYYWNRWDSLCFVYPQYTSIAHLFKNF